jgi:IS605 OrfB family transposase
MPANQHQPLIRTEKHVLTCSVDTRMDLARTVSEYRRLVRALSGMLFVHFAEVARAPSKCFAVERLFHVTADNPSPKYAVIDRMFPKFPSYLRRAAIEAAFGAVSSFLSNYDRWQSGLRSKVGSRPPSFGRTLDVNPPLYGGQCIKHSHDWSTARIKVLRADGSWGWSEPMPLRGRLKRLSGDDANQALSPTLIASSKRALLACPVKLSRPPWPGGDLVCAVDLGVNTAATCAIVDSAGAVRARQFLNCGRHNDRLDKAATQVRVKAEHTLGPVRLDKADDKVKRPGKLGKGFCRTLYARMRGLSQAVAQQVANAVVAFARDHGATTVVFENLKSFRPTAGAKGSALRQRFHRWLHRLLVTKATHKCEEFGLRVELVAPRGTSAWAHDGSGEVSRDKNNRSLCTFASGKRYNADLNAALNIAARFVAKMLGVTTGDRPAAGSGESSGPASRMPIVLADVWRHAGAPC